MPKENWRTYTGSQAGQVVAGLQVLLDSNALGEDEKRIAESMQRRLRSTTMRGADPSLVQFTKDEEELLTQVEAILWR